MARVYMGYDEKLDRYAAVKVSEPKLVAGEYDDEFRERFLREARAIARLKHANIIGVYQFNQVGASYYMAMELIEGKNLHQVLREYAKEDKRIGYDQIVMILRDVASALDYAHEQGIIHRDVKPSNIMIKADGHATLMDFGLALNVPEGTIGNTFGSVHYIAPEQAISSAQAVPQSDLYSLGVVLYEMLTGRVPFDDVSAMSVALKHISDPPPPPSTLNDKITPQIEEVVTKVLDKDPNKRYVNGLEFVRALESVLLDASDHKTEPGPQGEGQSRRTDGGSVQSSETDDAPTIRDTSSRPKSFPATARPVVPPPPPRERSNIGLIILGVVVFIAVVAGLIFAIGNFGVASNESATQTAVALIVEVTEEPSAAPTEVPSEMPTEVPTEVATDVPTEAPSAIPTEIPTEIPVQPTETAIVATQESTTAPIMVSSTATATTAPAAVVLRYDSRVLVLLNRSADQVVDIRDLTFAQITADGDDLVYRSREWTTGDLRRLGPGECFYVLTTSFTSLPINDPIFTGCDPQGFRQSSDTFWINSDLALQFEVRRTGQVFASCPVTGPRATIEKECNVGLTSSTITAQAATNVPDTTDVPTTTPTPLPSATPTVAITATESLVAEADDAQVLLIYDGRTLVLFNRDAENFVNIQGLTFVQEREDDSSLIFQSSEWRTGELFALRSNRCYQVWSVNYRRLPADEPPADICSVREGFNQTSRAFWVSDDPAATFEIRRSGAVLATCPVAIADETEILRCAVDIRSS